MKTTLPSLPFLAFVCALAMATDARAEHKADMQVGRSLATLQGDDVYGSRANQTLRLRMVRGVKFYARMEHDLELTNFTSLGSANVRLRGNHKSRLRLRVFRVDGGRIPVTAAVLGPGLELPELDVHRQADFLIRANRKQRAPQGLVRLSIIGVLVAAVETSRDTAGADLRVPRAR